MTQPRSPKEPLDEDEFPKDTESNETSSQQDAREWAKRRELLQAVLRYLTEHGTTSWAAVYIHFDKDGAGEVGKALGHLALRKHIVIEGTTAKITARGMEQLQSGK
jgi:hypothetical protein